VNVARPFEIKKAMVWTAYESVKRSKGGPGIDGVTIEEFEKDLKNNLYKIWNRMSSGTYFPPPVKRVAIPKDGGGERELGVPTIGDRIAQTVVKLYLEPIVEPHFHDDSYGYRPKRSAIDAVAKARERCWREDWVIDLDIEKFFDSLDHDLVIKAVKRFTQCKWILLYIQRWLRADVQLQDGTRQGRNSGTPQGGVISPLLANIFLHLAFDEWMKKESPDTHFERYADDIVVHCQSERQASYLKRRIETRLARCRLRAHPTKTRIVYCHDTRRRIVRESTSFDFLGYTFRPRSSKNHEKVLFVSFSPAVSAKATKAMRQVMRRQWKLKERTFLDLHEVAAWLNPIIRGWIQYYGKFCRSALTPVLNHINENLVGWAMRKFKRLRRRRTRANAWLKAVARREPQLFAHWPYQGWMTRAV
jgi:RNA-directed DNA polymerase